MENCATEVNCLLAQDIDVAQEIDVPQETDVSGSPIQLRQPSRVSLRGSRCALAKLVIVQPEISPALEDEDKTASSFCQEKDIHLKVASSMLKLANQGEEAPSFLQNPANTHEAVSSPLEETPDHDESLILEYQSKTASSPHPEPDSRVEAASSLLQILANQAEDPSSLFQKSVSIEKAVASPLQKTSNEDKSLTKKVLEKPTSSIPSDPDKYVKFTSSVLQRLALQTYSARSSLQKSLSQAEASAALPEKTPDQEKATATLFPISKAASTSDGSPVLKDQRKVASSPNHNPDNQVKAASSLLQKLASQVKAASSHLQKPATESMTASLPSTLWKQAASTSGAAQTLRPRERRKPEDKSTRHLKAAWSVQLLELDTMESILITQFEEFVPPNGNHQRECLEDSGSENGNISTTKDPSLEQKRQQLGETDSNQCPECEKNLGQTSDLCSNCKAHGLRPQKIKEVFLKLCALSDGENAKHLHVQNFNCLYPD
ncbi:hypothetical protein NDU88_006131 [Pleurodeles waltl]|uniref:Uncharacterized protein n=1 Tax=Pleurodeles waltl TaxID=8319 RepID=A0AAV7MZI8_PLEWA|nr:hypothetical protein NDU88_006131 [Pleurodeles waltl]